MLEYKTVIYKNLSENQKLLISKFLKQNFPKINVEDTGLEPNTIIILCTSENKIVGMVCLINNSILKRKLEEKKISLEYYNIINLDGLFIYNLCVDKDYRNKKIGYTLINKCISFISKYKFDYVHTQAESEISRILFLKNGFMEDNEFKINGNKFYVLSKFI